VRPGRPAGRGRRYSARDIEALREVQRLSQDEGVNLAGIKRILELEDEVSELQAEVRALQEQLAQAEAAASRREAAAHAAHRRDLVPVRRSAIVIWKPKR
jgi:MerR family transcriptional regulator/heat shock protein HspR